MQPTLSTPTVSTTDSADQPILKAWHYRAISLTIVFAVSIFLGLSIWVGWDKMSQAVTRIGAIGFFVAICLTLANLAVRLLRWQLYLKVLDIRVPLIKSMRIYIGGLALSATPGKTGEIIRSVFLKPYGATYMKSFAMFISDRFTDLVAVLILSTTILWANVDARPVAVLLAGIILLVMLSVQFPHQHKRVITTISSYIHWDGLTKLLFKTIDIVGHCKALFSLPIFLSTIVIALVAWTFEGLNLYIISHLLQTEIAFTTVLSIYAFSKLIGAISMIPGGMGTTEATLVGLFIYNGVDETTAITCALFLRLTTFWFVTTLGLIALPSRADVLANTRETPN